MMYEIPSEWVEATGYLAPDRRTIYGGDCMRRLAMLCGAIAMAALAGCGGQSGSGGGLVVGAFNPFSGGDASFGPEMLGGCIPAVQLINQAGGVMGHKVSC